MKKMTTLMTFQTGGGKKESCDAKCYDAKNARCVCCCGGRNHGAGFVGAFKNTVDHFEEMVEEAEKVKDLKIKATDIKRNERFITYFKELKKQLTLFGTESEEELLERIKRVKL